jgi:hypothetical protein
LRGSGADSAARLTEDIAAVLAVLPAVSLSNQGLLDEIAHAASVTMGNAAHMLSGREQGKVCSLLPAGGVFTAARVVTIIGVSLSVAALESDDSDLMWGFLDFTGCKFVSFCTAF